MSGVRASDGCSQVGCLCPVGFQSVGRRRGGAVGRRRLVSEHGGVPQSAVLPGPSRVRPAPLGSLVTKGVREVGSDAEIPFYRVSEGPVRRFVFHKEVSGQGILVRSCWEGLGLRAYPFHLVDM